jgi:UDP-N-acetylmuramoylalanine--D-glutamate ligase
VTPPVSDGFLSRDELRGRRVLVIGLGISGRAVARALVDAGAVVFASDSEAESASHPEVEALRERGVEVETGAHKKANRWLSQVEMAVPSPGITPRSGIVAHAIAEGVPVLSEIELAFRFTNRPVIAVTGTNGKTTTCRLIGAALAEDGRRVVVCGNIGRPFISAAIDSPDAQLFVVEVSSFQLTFCYAFHPHVAVVTNLAPDHLDWHGSMEAYRVAKGRIASRQTRKDWYVYPAAQPELADLPSTPGPRAIPFSVGVLRSGDGVWLDSQGIASRIASDVVVHVGGAENLARFGRPLVEDGLAATAACLALDAQPESLQRAFESFLPDHHRLEPLGELDSVTFVDDSKATNPHATVAGLRCFDRIVLIAGGHNKGLDLAPLRTEERRLLGVVALGEAAADVQSAFRGSDTPVRSVKTMEQAVDAAFAMAEPGSVVLLSPACASFDQFQDYAARGAAFKQAFEELARRKGRM